MLAGREEFGNDDFYDVIVTLLFTGNENPHQ